jgi:hypothetical protein
MRAQYGTVALSYPPIRSALSAHPEALRRADICPVYHNFPRCGRVISPRSAASQGRPLSQCNSAVLLAAPRHSPRRAQHDHPTRTLPCVTPVGRSVGLGPLVIRANQTSHASKVAPADRDDLLGRTLGQPVAEGEEVGRRRGPCRRGRRGGVLRARVDRRGVHHRRRRGRQHPPRAGAGRAEHPRRGASSWRSTRISAFFDRELVGQQSEPGHQLPEDQIERSQRHDRRSCPTTTVKQRRRSSAWMTGSAPTGSTARSSTGSPSDDRCDAPSPARSRRLPHETAGRVRLLRVPHPRAPGRHAARDGAEWRTIKTLSTSGP